MMPTVELLACQVIESRLREYGDRIQAALVRGATPVGAPRGGAPRGETPRRDRPAPAAPGRRKARRMARRGY